MRVAISFADALFATLKGPTCGVLAPSCRVVYTSASFAPFVADKFHDLTEVMIGCLSSARASVSVLCADETHISGLQDARLIAYGLKPPRSIHAHVAGATLAWFLGHRDELDQLRSQTGHALLRRLVDEMTSLWACRALFCEPL